MTICIKIDEMLDILQHMNHPGFDAYKAMTEKLAEAIAAAVSGVVPELVFTGNASFEGSLFDGTCATFDPKEPGPVPAVLDYFDIEVQQWKDLCLEMAEHVNL